MRQRTLIALAVLLAPCHTSASPSDAAIAAIGMPELQFRTLLSAVIFRTQTMGMGAYALGIDGACAVTKPAFDKVIAAHLPEWSANLVRSYRENIPADVLTNATAGSPVAAVPMLGPYIDKVGGAMQAASEPILKSAAAEVLLPVFNATATVDLSKVDGANRQAELEKALAAGTAQCGLVPSPRKPS